MTSPPIRTSQRLLMGGTLLILVGCQTSLPTPSPSGKPEPVDRKPAEPPEETRLVEGAGSASGTPQDIAFAERLWAALEEVDLAGPSAIQSHAYAGEQPHGAFLQYFERELRVGNQTQPVILQRHYRAPDITRHRVAQYPRRHLAGSTVMYRRPGYAPAHQDWFWAQYTADGALRRDPGGQTQAGRVGGDLDTGCIACHRDAPGGDYVFGHDRFAESEPVTEPEPEPAQRGAALSPRDTPQSSIRNKVSTIGR